MNAREQNPSGQFTLDNAALESISARETFTHKLFFFYFNLERQNAENFVTFYLSNENACKIYSL